MLVEVSTEINPVGELSVLVQFGDQWHILMSPGNARTVARMIIDGADECERSSGKGASLAP